MLVVGILVTDVIAVHPHLKVVSIVIESAIITKIIFGVYSALPLLIT